VDEPISQSIIPDDANELEAGDDNEGTTLQPFGSIPDEQLEKLAGLISDRVIEKVLAVLKEVPKAEAKEVKAETKDETSAVPSPDPVATWLLSKQKTPVSTPESSEAATRAVSTMLESASSAAPAPGAAGNAVLAMGQPMPAPAHAGSNKAFAAFCRLTSK
jgi:hypothetical protein